ncbi:MAG: aldehyde dehydrogenase [Chloroflexi bacterium]|nr:aldehyde dehydrogenase [Chloroflexota bacterium]
MDSGEAVRILRKLAGDALVVSSLGTPSYLLNAAGDRPEHFYLWAAMGMASSVGLGLAVAQPDRRVVVLDGDGAALMNLGSMVTVGSRAPRNLLWMILENGAFLETGGQEIATAASADLVQIAHGAGIARAARAEAADDLRVLIERGLAESGPSLVVARVGRDGSRDFPPVDPVRIRLRFIDALAARSEPSSR